MIDHLVGVPFVDRGRSRDGCDCYGLVMLAYRDLFGVDLPDFAYKAAQDRGSVDGAIQAGIGEWWEIERLQAVLGDCVLLSQGRRPCHIGLYDGVGRVLHAERGTGAILQPLRDPRLASRVLGFYRYDVTG